MFRQYARRPMPMQQSMPVGIMASSPELIQAAMNYAEGGSVSRGRNRGPSSSFRKPSVDITQNPVEFKEPVTFSRGRNRSRLRAASAEPESADPVAADPVAADQLDAAVAAGEEKQNNPNDKKTSEVDKADAAMGAAGRTPPEGTKGKIGAMKKLIQDAFGQDASRLDSLKALNSAFVGFAIAEGGDIATALKQGAQGASRLEESQLARQDKMSEMALGQVFAEKLAGMRAAGSQPSTNKARNPINAYQDAYNTALALTKDAMVVAQLKNQNISPQQYATDAAKTLLLQTYTPEELMGTQFQSLIPKDPPADITAPTATGTGGTNDMPSLEEFIKAAQEANPDYTVKEITVEYNKRYGN